jgi:hypothetical protein
MISVAICQMISVVASRNKPTRHLRQVIACENASQYSPSNWESQRKRWYDCEPHACQPVRAMHHKWILRTKAGLVHDAVFA